LRSKLISLGIESSKDAYAPVVEKYLSFLGMGQT